MEITLADVFQKIGQTVRTEGPGQFQVNELN